ncbi:MAG: hypothetical protein K2G37_05560 [Clostridia bacterium]|nr:hypothetical protein [Clostridia bacterium]
MPVFFFIAIGMMIAGSATSNDLISKIGTTLLTVFFPILAIVLVGAILGSAIRGKGKNSTDKQSEDESREKSDNDEFKTYDDADNIAIDNFDSKELSSLGEESLDEKEKELSQIENINSSVDYDNRMKQGEFIASHSAKIFQTYSKKQKILSTLFLIYLLTTFALIFVFGYFHIIPGVITCISLFAGTIIICMIVVKVSERLSMRKIDVNSGKYEIVCGAVKNCFLSSTTSSGGMRGTQITGVVYRVVVNANGKDYTAYSREFRTRGDIVMIAIIGKKRATIIDGDELIEKYDGVVGKFDDNDDSDQTF